MNRQLPLDFSSLLNSLARLLVTMWLDLLIAISRLVGTSFVSFLSTLTGLTSLRAAYTNFMRLDLQLTVLSFVREALRLQNLIATHLKRGGLLILDIADKFKNGEIQFKKYGRAEGLCIYGCHGLWPV